MPERVLSLAREVGDIAAGEVAAIQQITKRTKMLAFNALIEGAHAGEQGRGFAVVAGEIKAISDEINSHASALTSQLSQRLTDLNRLGGELTADIYGKRLTDLAFNLIEIIDRNLYERSCDVRWWATDAAVVEVCAEPTPDHAANTGSRLGVILDAYTVYLDIWVCDARGQVLTNGRPQRFPQAVGSDVQHEDWFRHAMSSKSGDDFAVSDISRAHRLGDRLVATYAAAVRERGEKNGRVLGVIGIFFDWQAQAQTVVEGVRLSEKERARTRCMIVDAKHKVIAASDHQGILEETFKLRDEGNPTGHYREGENRVVGFARTPGYETYKGLGWYGVITQRLGE